MLKRCSLCLVTVGANFFVKNRGMKVLRTVMRIFVLIAIIGSIQNVQKDWVGGLSLTATANTTFVASRIIILTSLIFRRRHFEEFLREIVSVVPYGELKRIHRFILVVTTSVFTILLILIHAYMTLPKYWGSDLVWYTWRFVESLSLCWITLTCGMYAIALKILFASFAQKTHLLKLKIMTGADASVQLRYYRSEVQELHARFENLFNLMPLLWFCAVVVEGPRIVLILYDSTLIEFLLFLCWPVNCIVSPVAVCFLVSSLMSRMNSSLNDVFQLICKNRNHLPVPCEIIHHIESLKSLQFTGLSFFAINRSFVLSLIGTIFTVSALLEQYMKHA